MVESKQEKCGTDENANLMDLRSRIESLYQWRQLEVVWLKQRLNLSNQKIARILNYKPQTVSLIWHKWKNDRDSFFHLNRPGGRKRSYLTVEEESEFIAPFLTADEINVKEIKEEYQSIVAREVADSTIYRLLSRHEWKHKKGMVGKE